jgi:integrase
VRSVERGLDAFALQQMLGHASLKTSEIYLRWADQRKAMERARKALEGPAGILGSSSQPQTVAC